jgi:hypothetical protein
MYFTLIDAALFESRPWMAGFALARMDPRTDKTRTEKQKARTGRAFVA